MRKRWAVGLVIVGVLAFAGGAGANGWIITSINQIKPGVLQKIQPRLRQLAVIDPAVQTMCPSGSAPGSGCEVVTSDARCPGGTAIGGGWDGGSNPSPAETVGYNERDSDGGGWHVIAVNNDPYSSATIQATAICLGQNNFLAHDASAPAAVQAQIRREVVAERAKLK